MVDLSNSVYLVYITAAAILSVLGLINNIRNIQVTTLTSSRKKTLYPIATCSNEFRSFYRFLNSPDGQLVLTNRRMKIKYGTYILAVIAAPGLVFVYAAASPPLNYLTIFLASSITLVAFPIVGILLRYLTQKTLDEEITNLRPSNKLIVLFSNFKFLNPAALILFAAYLIGPIREFDSFMATSTAADIEATLVLVSIILITYGFFFLLIRNIISGSVCDLDDRFFRAYFSQQAPNLEVVVRDEGGQDLQTVQGSLVGVGRALLVRRIDGFIMRLEWRSIRRVGASPPARPINAIQ